ncbi:MAG: Holliday junction resolvase RuvX [bacterium]
MEIKGRILGLDYGRKRIGVSISDPLQITAQPLYALEGLKETEKIERILKLIEQYDVKCVVVGYPLTLKGKTSQFTNSVIEFIEKLRDRIQIKVILWDERLTSVQAHRIMHDMNLKPSRNKSKVDVIASVLILTNYLDHLNQSFNN